MKYSVDVVRIRENAIQLNGWAIGKTPESKITYEVEDGDTGPWISNTCPPGGTT